MEHCPRPLVKSTPVANDPPQRSPTWLNERAANVRSQAGEDGVIRAILEVLPEKTGWCVEVGAWDGRFLSNTCHLVEHSGFRAVMIEADPSKHAQIQLHHPGDHVIALLAKAGWGQDDSLDALLAPLPVPREFDLLSIDIDGNDCHVWQALKAYEPKIVVIEFNPTIPVGVRFVQAADPGVKQGSSLASLMDLAQAKGYELAAALPFTAFFVRSDLFPLLQISDNSEATLRTSLDLVTHLFFGFDGSVLLSGGQRLPWHDLPLAARKMQVLPRLFRQFPGDFSTPKQWLFHLWRSLRGRG